MDRGNFDIRYKKLVSSQIEGFGHHDGDAGIPDETEDRLDALVSAPLPLRAAINRVKVERGLVEKNGIEGD